MKIGKRIIVVGSPGSGKSTFSRQLAKITGLKLIHLDKEYWDYGWKETPLEEWIKKQEELVTEDEWIIDGSYAGTMHIRLVRADTVFFFDLNRFVCLFRYLKRLISNFGRVRPDMPDGCLEKIDFKFIKYILKYPKKGKKILYKLENYFNKDVIVFKKHSSAKRFLEYLQKNYYL